MKHVFKAAAAIFLLAAPSVAAPPAGPFTLSSRDFKDGAVLPRAYGGKAEGRPNCLGENVSPHLAWSNVPEGTRSLVFYMYDPEGRAGSGVTHWIAYGVPPARGQFERGEIARAPSGFVGGKSTQDLATYMGPCPPPNTSYHHYTFVVIATDLAPDELPAGLTKDEVIAKINGRSKGVSGLVARFRYPGTAAK